MFMRQLQRKQNIFSPRLPIPRTRQAWRRFQSSSPSPNPNAAKTHARAEKVLNRIPRFLRKYTDGLRDAPVTHVVAFLVLHELTAVIPLIGLASYFHYAKWLPPFFSEGAYLSSGIEKFGNYFRRKRWFGLSEDSSIPTTKRAKAWNFSETGTRIVVEVATAYAITKVLLPLRLMLSVWATPWFARVAIGKLGSRLTGLGKRLIGRGKGSGKSPAAGTGATGTGTSAVGKETPKR